MQIFHFLINFSNCFLSTIFLNLGSFLFLIPFVLFTHYPTKNRLHFHLFVTTIILCCNCYSLHWLSGSYRRKRRRLSPATSNILLHLISIESYWSGSFYRYCVKAVSLKLQISSFTNGSKKPLNITQALLQVQMLLLVRVC